MSARRWNAVERSGGVHRRSTAACLLAVLLLGGGAAAGADEFSFERLNRTWEGFITDLSPVEVGQARVLLSSPTHSLTILRHSARLRPDGRGGHHVDLELRFGGRGTIDADIEFGRIRSRLSDELVVPPQTLQLSGRVAIRTSDDGYLVTTTELPATVTVTIQSQLARQLFSLCRQMALVLVNMDCETLEDSLTNLQVPMPAPGQTYLLPLEELTGDERKLFEAYLTRDLLNAKP